ncbi:MAG: TIGR01212 family radical SAM protein [Candidatus Omnitrophota bacterium]|nr:TIGR01212 family radical SAM protein [Candidatus Omnitrophota bacterium]
MEEYFYSFNDYLRKKFGRRVQRLSLNAGFTCPNRDGKISTEGCIYCNEDGFSPFAGTRLSLKAQIQQSIDYAKRRYKAEKYIAYFQNATNTYGSLYKLKKAYNAIKEFPDIVGLSISTRPDCVDKKKLDLIAAYCDNYDVWIEYGLQSVHDRTLDFINRGHCFHDFVKAAEMTVERNIKTGVHVILGLPGENREDILMTAKKIAKLPVSGIKFHALHVFKKTKLEEYYNGGRIQLLTFNEYVGIVCDFLEVTNPECVAFRLVSDARKDILVEPKWINRKSEVINAVKDEFKKRGTKQGSFWSGNTN